MGIKKGMNRGAYQGKLTCPGCDSESIRFLEMIGPYRERYRCRKCGLPFQYETGQDHAHPYAPFANKSKFKKIITASELRTGAQLKQRSRS